MPASSRTGSINDDKTLQCMVNSAKVAGFQTGGFVAVHALFLAEKPLVFVVFENLMERDECPCLGIEVLVRLITAG